MSSWMFAAARATSLPRTNRTIECTNYKNCDKATPKSILANFIFERKGNSFNEREFQIQWRWRRVVWRLHARATDCECESRGWRWAERTSWRLHLWFDTSFRTRLRRPQ